MPSICPQCKWESQLESDFCPACGAPMNPDAYRIQKERLQKNQVLLPMKWHKFLTHLSLPLGILVGLYNLYTAITFITGFDAAAFRPEALDAVRWLMYGDLVSAIVLLPGLTAAEWGLMKMRRLGVRAILGVYLYQALYMLFSLYCFLQMQPDMSLQQNVLTVYQSGLMGAEMLVMFILTGVYYRKRKGLFS